jgi:hypothetical protein
MRIVNRAAAAKDPAPAVEAGADEALKDWQKKHASDTEGPALDAGEAS